VRQSTTLEDVLKSFLPGRKLKVDLSGISNHDHRAGVVCALTALAVLKRKYVAVGDAQDGDIILPPKQHWGISDNSSGPWMWAAISKNLRQVQKGRNSNINSQQARIAENSGPTFPSPNYHCDSPIVRELSNQSRLTTLAR